MRGQDYESGSTKGKILEFIRNNRNEWLSSDDIYIPVKNEAEKRRVIGWLKRWEKMGIVRKATVKEVVDARSFMVLFKPFFSLYVSTTIYLDFSGVP